MRGDTVPHIITPSQRIMLYKLFLHIQMYIGWYPETTHLSTDWSRLHNKMVTDDRVGPKNLNENCFQKGYYIVI